MAVNYNNPPVPYPNPIRYSLATPLSNRAQDVTVDGVMSNCYIEPERDTGKVFVRKRAGFDQAFSFAAGAATSQGLAYFKGYLFGVGTNVMYSLQAPVAVNYATGAAFTQATAPTWTGRYYFNAVIFKNQIVVIGGFNAATTFNDVWGSSDGENWVQLCSAAPWGARQAMTAVVFNDRLFVMGGVGPGGVLYNDVWVSDDGQTWNQLTNNAGWVPRSGLRAVVFNSGIFVMGGYGATANLNDVWFSTDGTNWVQQVANAAWTVRGDFGLAVLGNEMFVYGGYTTVGPAYRNDCYSTKDGITWTLENAAAFASGRAFFGYTVYENKLWALGGQAAAGELADVYSSVDGAAWVLVGAAPGWNARHGLSAVTFRAPTAQSSINTPILWTLGGVDAALAVKREVWRGNVNGVNNATWGVPTPSGVVERLQNCTANANEYLCWKDTAGMYVFTGNTLARVLDPNYPPKTVPGVVNLDETIYVMDTTGLIYGSAIGNPFVWPAFKYIGADYESDNGVAIAKHRDYLIAFGEYTTQAFFNSGSAFGALLRPVKNANITVGCSFADTIVDCDDTLVFMGRGRFATGRRIYKMEGLVVKAISNPFIERIIQQTTYSQARGTYLKFNGHRFYAIQIGDPVFRTFAYDFDTGLWFRLFFKQAWWNLNMFATDGTKDYYLRDSESIVYAANATTMSDAGTAIILQVVTNNIDGDTTREKFCHGISLVCDRNCGDVALEFNDNDYDAASWSAARTFNTDLGVKKFRKTRWGSFVKRAFRLTHTSATKPFRAEALELEVDMGFR